MARKCASLPAARMVVPSAQTSTLAPVERISASASVRDGLVTLTMANLSMDEEEEITLTLPGTGKAVARILTGDARAYNDFDHAPLQVTAFTDLTTDNDVIRLRMPRCSVVELSRHA